MEEKFPKYLENKPIGKDQFEGKSHEKIALSIAENIQNEKSHKVLGIEGEWGSGKSNIIEILKEKLKESHYIYVYDAWGHQEDSQRRAFLEEMTEELISEKLLNEKTEYTSMNGEKQNITWEEKIKYLLSRKRETSKKTIPKLSNGIILIFFSFLLTPLLPAISNFLSEKYYVNKILVLLFPFIFYLIVYIIYMPFYWHKNKKMPSFSSFFYIYKGEELENTTYEIFSDLEPSVKEFKEWIQSISDSLNSKNLVVVYDNMDRLPPEKVKEIWSSVHTFFAEEGYDKIDVIIPFDRTHLQKAFKNSDSSEEDTKEFVNKTFFTIYRATPPVLSDWKKFFSDKFKEAFNESENKELQVVTLIFDRLTKKFTPREIIVFINELVTYKKIWKEEILLRYIAIFSLKKEEILNNPSKSILDRKYLENIEDLFMEESELLNSISALTFNVSVKKASQVLLFRDLELALRGKETSSIEGLSKHPNFIEILEEVIKTDSGSMNIDKVISNLSKLEIEKIKGNNIKERIRIIWDKLVKEQCKKEILELSFEKKYKNLLLYSSEGSQKKLLEYLVNKFYGYEEIKGEEYYNSFNELLKFVLENKIDFSIKSYLSNRNVSPEIFLNYLSVANQNYKNFKMIVNKDELDQYILEKLPDNLNDIPNFKSLNNIIGEYTLVNTIEKIEDIISKNTLTKDNFSQILELYKALSNEKPLKRIINTANLYNLLYNLTEEDKGYYDLIALRLQYGNKYNNGRDDFINKTDEKIVEEVSKIIEYYNDYDNLLLLITEWNKPLLKEVCKNLVLNGSENQRLNVIEVLKKYEQIKVALEIESKKILESLEGWAEQAEKKINSKNIKEVIPEYLFYKDSTSVSLDLTEHINRIVEDFINEIDEETLLSEWGKEDSYIYNTLKILLEKKKFDKFPENIRIGVKKIFVEIAKNEKDIPQEESLYFYLIEKLKKEDIDATVENIRDHFIKENNISFERFIFFEEVLRLNGKLDERANEVSRTILDRVFEDNDCSELILKENKFYSSIINKSETGATDLKEKISNKLKNESSNEELKKFAYKIGILIEEKKDDK